MKGHKCIEKFCGETFTWKTEEKEGKIRMDIDRLVE
jgi:hypothetical protein